MQRSSPASSHALYSPKVFQTLIDIPRICIAATSGGGGKTIFSLGLGRLWQQIGLRVKPFKKGPDYIDAAWLAAACGQEATNLDLYFLEAAPLKNLFVRSCEKADVALVEGNRGLYDGLNESGTCSTAQVARIIDSPVILCLDCEKTTRTMAAIVHGLASFEPGLNFAGVILNRVGSARHEQALRLALEKSTDLPVLGALPRLPRNPIPERHMGLAAIDEQANEILDKLAQWVRAGCDYTAILAAAQKAPPLPRVHPRPPAQISESAPLIGLLQDQAFWFYYQENLLALEEAGCRIRPVSILDPTLDLSPFQGLYLGGGYPEEFLPQISASPALPKIKEFILDGMPVYAECGGLMILCHSIMRNNKSWAMTGIIPAVIHWHDRPRGLGYVKGEICGNNPWYPENTMIKGHEFHYSSCIWRKQPSQLAMRLFRGSGMFEDKAGLCWDGYIKNRLWASYTHIFAPGLPAWAQTFAQLA